MHKVFSLIDFIFFDFFEKVRVWIPVAQIIDQNNGRINECIHMHCVII